MDAETKRSLEIKILTEEARVSATARFIDAWDSGEYAGESGIDHNG